MVHNNNGAYGNVFPAVSEILSGLTLNIIQASDLLFCDKFRVHIQYMECLMNYNGIGLRRQIASRFAVKS